MKPVSFSSILPKGSVLVFSFLILSIMLVTALTILSSALLNQKAALSTGNSARSFNVANSGVEKMLYEIYKENRATPTAIAAAISGGSCSNGVILFPIVGGSAKVTLYQDDTTVLASCADAAWRDKVVKIKSEGTLGASSRAVEVAVAAGSGQVAAWVNFDGTNCGGGTCSMRDSFNVSSVTRNAQGDFTVNFSSAMPNSNYAVVTSGTFRQGANRAIDLAPSDAGSPYSTTSIRLSAFEANSGLMDPKYANVTIIR